MRTLFRSLDLWDLVEKGVDEDEGEARLKEIPKMECKSSISHSASCSSINVLTRCCCKYFKGGLGDPS